MNEILRTRDVTVLFKGDSYTVAVSQNMRQNGWAGGQGVRWVDSTTDQFLVDYSDGLYGGFLLWGSDEPSDEYTSITESQPKYGYATFCAGGWLMSTVSFERYTYASRTAGPLVPITYTPGVRLRFSLRGLWTPEDEWTLSADPRGANEFYVGSIVEAPSTATNDMLTIQTSI